MKRALIKVFVGMALVCAMVPASATLIHLMTTLSGPNESPPNASPGTGFVFVDLDTTANTLFVDATFSGLLGVTTASHIHCCTLVAGTGVAGVATTTPNFTGFPLGVTSGHFVSTLDLTLASSYNPSFVTANGGLAGAEAALISGLLSGKTYYNIHTNRFPGGEIRGFLLVPEPLTISLIGVGIAIGLASRRRRRA